MSASSASSNTTTMSDAALPPPPPMIQSPCPAPPAPAPPPMALGAKPPSPAADAAPAVSEAAKPRQAPQQLKEKSEAYWYLWSEVFALQASHGLPLKASFLKLDDASATALNDRIKSQRLKQFRALADMQVIKREVFAAFADY